MTEKFWKNVLKVEFVIGIAMAVAAVVLLVGCSNTSAIDESPVISTTTTTVPVPATTTTDAPPSQENREAAFLYLANKSAYASSPDESKISLAHTICKTLTDGTSARDIANTLVSSSKGNVTFAQAAYYMGLSIATYCPENESKMTEAN